MQKYKKYDVIVVGGGSAGVAAALGAVKAGASCLLVERNGSLGGQATNSNVASYCGFFTHGDNPKQIVNGIGGEILKQLKELGGEEFKLSTTKNAIITFDEEILKYTLDMLVKRYDLEVLLHCRMIKANMTDDGKRICSIECVDDVNWYEFEADTFVDASGDGNLAYLSGAKIRFGNGEGGEYLSSKIMRIDHISPEVNFAPAILEKAIKQAKIDGYKHLTKEAGIVFKTADDTAYAILPSVDIASLDAHSMTKYEMETREQCHDYIEVFRKYIPGMESARLVSTGNKIGIRDTRHIIGEYTITKDDVLGAVKHQDGIARGAWPCEMHNEITKMLTYLWVPDNDYYDIPLRALKARNIKNLWCGGRVISADPVAFASVRVMGTSFATGHAAGVAAALNSGEKKASSYEIQKELNRQGANIGNSSF